MMNEGTTLDKGKDRKRSGIGRRVWFPNVVMYNEGTGGIFSNWAQYG